MAQTLTTWVAQLSAAAESTGGAQVHFKKNPVGDQAKVCNQEMLEVIYVVAKQANL